MLVDVLISLLFFLWYMQQSSEIIVKILLLWSYGNSFHLTLNYVDVVQVLGSWSSGAPTCLCLTVLETSWQDEEFDSAFSREPRFS